ncbi:hypothetical protein ACF06X_01120 [Streptomyces sp. NPDC015346]|uniref:hypothetical protein n=1 Tax=Streptomyces sp. NPDC015346 TaxID=3364954 RepID=UPI0036F53F70
MSTNPDTRKSARSALGIVAAIACLLSVPLTACGSGAPEPARQNSPGAPVSLVVDARAVGESLESQAAAQQAAAQKAAKAKATMEKSRGLCTTDPADRSNCRNPGGRIDPKGGDLDGDGVFEDHEPVGPGYRDPRAYDGGRTSGETQCEWLRSQGITC